MSRKKQKTIEVEDGSVEIELRVPPLYGNYIVHVKEQLVEIVRRVRQQSFAKPFNEPMRGEQAQALVLPMDLQTVSQRLSKNFYVTLPSFLKDINQILLNAQLLGPELAADSRKLKTRLEKELKQLIGAVEERFKNEPVLGRPCGNALTSLSL
jgi:hypothetical protein